MNNDSPPEFHPSFYGPRYWHVWLSLALFKVLGWLPYRVSMGIGRVLGDLFYYLAPRRRKIAEVNIAKCFPQLSAAEQRKLVRKILHSTGKSLIESAVALWGPIRHFEQHTVIGLEYILSALAKGEGVLMVGCHQTTLDAVARILSLYFKFDTLYRKDANPLLAFKLIQAREKYIGSAIVRTDTRQLIRRLREGHVVWYAPDQDYGPRHSVFAPFFGVQAATVVGTARITQLGRAKVIPLAHYRDDNNRYRIVFSPPLENYPSGDDVADATRINHILEQAILQQPDQYLWVHRRFKTRPPGEPDFYRNN